jgi:hypothetical protein
MLEAVLILLLIQRNMTPCVRNPNFSSSVWLAIKHPYFKTGTSSSI